MDTEVKLDSTLSSPRAVIYAPSLSDEVNEAVRRLSSVGAHLLPGALDGEIALLRPAQVERIYAQQGQVLAVSGGKEYVLRRRLYELEDMLLSDGFVRISNSEIVNFAVVKALDFSLLGTVSLKLAGGGRAFVSRRYIDRIKAYVGLKEGK